MSGEQYVVFERLSHKKILLVSAVEILTGGQIHDLEQAVKLFRSVALKGKKALADITVGSKIRFLLISMVCVFTVSKYLS